MNEPTCSVTDDSHSRGGLRNRMCGKHYDRWRKNGDPLVVRSRWDGVTDEGRFLAKVRKDGPVPAHRPELGPCWAWTGARTGSGYGVFYLNGEHIGAHRASYELFVGPILDGMEPDHLCHPNDGSCRMDKKCPHRLCPNPAHLELVTHRENVERGTSPFAGNIAKTHCPQGHEYTPENTRIRIGASGHENRSCKECDRLRKPEPTGEISPLIAANAAKTHCPKGHEYTPENTIIDYSVGGKKGGRRCKTCRREQRQKRQVAG